MKYTTLAILLFSVFSCNQEQRHQNTTRLLKSNNVNEIIEGCNNLRTIKDRTFICLLLEKPFDERISHDLRFKGMSVYEAKMRALIRITGHLPPNTINYKLDSLNIEYYVNWANKNGYCQ